MEILYIVLSILQGFLEWWPVSSSSVSIIVSKYFGLELEESFYLALALHLPSGLAALLLLRDKYVLILREVMRFNTSEYTRSYLLSLLVSIATGLLLYYIYVGLTREYSLIALFIISIGLLVTSTFLFIKPKSILRENVLLIDWLITGLLQGLSVIPGFSRSGLTIGYLCIRGYKPLRAVETSILLATPVLILAGLYNLLRIHTDLPILLIASFIVFATTLLSGKLIIYTARRTRVYLFTLLLAILIFINIVLEFFIE